jgi:hypothetical protein
MHIGIVDRERLLYTRKEGLYFEMTKVEIWSFIEHLGGRSSMPGFLKSFTIFGI